MLASCPRPKTVSGIYGCHGRGQNALDPLPPLRNEYDDAYDCVCVLPASTGWTIENYILTTRLLHEDKDRKTHLQYRKILGKGPSFPTGTVLRNDRD